MNGAAGGEVDSSKIYDAIVVGSGLGGGTVAAELSRRGWQTLILEQGHAEALKGTAGQTVAMAMMPGKSLHFTQEMLGLIHATAVGGSSAIYYATAFEPPFEMFDAYGIDLRAEVAEAREELPIAPLADNLIGPAARRITDSARQIGLQWEKLPKIVYQDKCRPACDKCVMGCPYDAKWSSRMYVDEARAGRATLVTGASVRQVIRENGRAVGVAYQRNGRRQQARAKTIILAGGGIGTPQVLRRSGIANVGQDFFFDPLVFVIGEVDDLNGGREFPMATGCRLHDEGIVLTDLVLPRWLYWLFTAQVLRFDRLAAHKKSLPIMIKARDELGGHLTQGGGVRKRLGAVERKRLAKGQALARQILENAGARHIYRTWYLATHPGGTAKINEAVNTDLKTKFQGLYVCDCSVIPEAWGLPPSLTLIALAKRLARHLDGQK